MKQNTSLVPLHEEAYTISVSDVSSVNQDVNIVLIYNVYFIFYIFV